MQTLKNHFNYKARQRNIDISPLGTGFAANATRAFSANDICSTYLVPL